MSLMAPIEAWANAHWLPLMWCGSQEAAPSYCPSAAINAQHLYAAPSHSGCTISGYGQSPTHLAPLPPRCRIRCTRAAAA
jgi:hypothetical protein